MQLVQSLCAVVALASMLACSDPPPADVQVKFNHVAADPAQNIPVAEIKADNADAVAAALEQEIASDIANEK